MQPTPLQRYAEMQDPVNAPVWRFYLMFLQIDSSLSRINT